MVTESFDLPPGGDLNRDALVDPNDITLLRDFLADPNSLTAAEVTRCTDRSITGNCDIVEWVTLERGLLELAPGLGERCTP